MRKKITLLALALSTFAFSQVAPQLEWAKAYGGTSAELGSEIIQTTDGGYAFIGYANSNDGQVTGNQGMANVWFVKTDASGTLEWQKTYGGTFSDVGNSLKQTPDGGYIIGASIYSNDGDISENNSEFGMGEDFWLVKISSTGEIEWENNYGGNYAEILRDVQLTADGGYIAAGTTLSKSDDVVGGYGIEGNFFQEGWVVKVDAQGEMQWQRPYGGYEGFVEFSSIRQTPEGGYIIGGYAGYGFDGDFPATHEGSVDWWALKIDATGDIEWSKVFGGSTDDYGSKITPTSDGGYIMTGSVYSNNGDIVGGLGNGNTDLWVLKLDNLGVIEWQKLLSGTGSEGAIIAYETPDHNFVLGGGSNSANGDFAEYPNDGIGNWLFIKLNGTDGSLIWMKTMGGSLGDGLFDFKITEDGGFVGVGYTNSNDGHVSGNHGQSDIWVVKLGPDCIVPELTIDTTQTVCSGEALTLDFEGEAATVNWYDTADAETPIFTGSAFETPVLTETTSYWVEAANFVCKTPRTEITVIVEEALPAPSAEAEQEFEEGLTLADLIVEHTGTLVWYLDADLTQELPESTLTVAGTTYYVTQTSGTCESGATVIVVDDFLSNPDFQAGYFAYYPNPVKSVLNFRGNETVKTIQVYDINSKLVWNQHSGSISSIDLSSLPNGVYLVKAITEKGVKNFKIVRN